MKTFGEFAEDLDEALDLSQRLARKRSFLKHKSKIMRGKKIKSRRMAKRDALKKRSHRAARTQLAAKFTGGKSKSDMSLAQRQAIEKRLDSRKGAISKLAKRLFPTVRKKEIARLKSRKASK